MVAKAASAEGGGSARGRRFTRVGFSRKPASWTTRLAVAGRREEGNERTDRKASTGCARDRPAGDCDAGGPGPGSGDHRQSRRLRHLRQGRHRASRRHRHAEVGRGRHRARGGDRHRGQLSVQSAARGSLHRERLARGLPDPAAGQGQRHSRSHDTGRDLAARPEASRRPSQSLPRRRSSMSRRPSPASTCRWTSSPTASRSLTT